MNDETAEEIELSALLNSFVYLDNDVTGMEGGTLKEIVGVIGMNMEARGEEARPEYLQLKAAIEANPSFGEVVLMDRSRTNETEPWTDDLIQAATFRDASGNFYVAYRGTGEGRWADNGDGMTARSTQMQRAAADYFDSVAQKYMMDAHENGASIIVTGHSKGGNESQYVTVAAEYEYLIDHCYSFDGQGFSAAAVEDFRNRYGEEYFHRQQGKMFSICGENDYVHDLGNTVVPASHTYYVPTTGNGMTAWHHISNMIGTAVIGAVTYTGLAWERAEDGGILHGRQGSVGELARALNDEMMTMDEEDLHGTAVALMWGIDYFCMAENKDEWEMLGDVSVSPTDFVDFMAHGAPAIARTMIATPEGRKVLGQLIRTAAGSAYERFGVFGVVGLAGLTVLLAGPVKDIGAILGKVASAAETGDMVIDFLDDLKGLPGRAGRAIANIRLAAADRISSGLDQVRRNSAGGRIAGQELRLFADTGSLRSTADRLQHCRDRFDELEGRICGLYRLTGLPGLLSLVQAQMLRSEAWRIGRCCSWLQTAADRLDETEKTILEDGGRLI